MNIILHEVYGQCELKKFLKYSRKMFLFCRKSQKEFCGKVVFTVKNKCTKYLNENIITCKRTRKNE